MVLNVSCFTTKIINAAAAKKLYFSGGRMTYPVRTKAWQKIKEQDFSKQAHDVYTMPQLQQKMGAVAYTIYMFPFDKIMETPNNYRRSI